jgi:poly(A) polymerase
VELPGVPSAVLATLQSVARERGIRRLALVGGAVRDALLHHQHRDPWRGLPDLDLVVEGSAPELAEALRQMCGNQRVPELRAHGAYGTVELVLDGVLLDLAGARQEHYPAPAENPLVQPGPLELDLARRDFTVNAMALDLPLRDTSEPPRLLDPHGGQRHLALRQLAFLHAGSVADDPTRVFRAARYAARLGFSLAPEAMQQVDTTLRRWPWRWRHGDPPDQAPPALATRLRMELELLLTREPWRRALQHLQHWGVLALLDPSLQANQRLERRLTQAARLGLPLLLAFVARAGDPVALAARLQLPLQQQRDLAQLTALLRWIHDEAAASQRATWSALEWTQALEERHCSPDAVALAACGLLADQNPSWRPLLRWWGRWRHLKPPLTARQLIARGWQPGPALGAELVRLRRQALAAMS